MTWQHMRHGLAIALFSCLIGSVTLAADEAAIGTVVHIVGEASVQRNGEAPIVLQFGDGVYPQDILQTGEGELRILFRDDTLLSLVAHSKVMITEHVYRPEQGLRRTIFDVISGGIKTIVERSAQLVETDVRIQTPTAVAGIRGTTVGAHHDPTTGETHFLCFYGQIETFHRDYPGESQFLNAGQITKVVDGPPQYPAPIPDDWHEYFSNGHSSLNQILNQPGAEGLDTLANIGGPETSGGGASTGQENANLYNPPGFSGLPGALQEIPFEDAGMAGGGNGGGAAGGGAGGGGADGGGAGGGGAGGGAGGDGGGGGGGNAPVNVQPSFPDPG